MDKEINGILPSMIERINQIVEIGGPIVAILGVFSIISVAIIFLKLWQFAAMGVRRRKVARLAVGKWIAGQRQAAYADVVQHNSVISNIVAHAMRGQMKLGSENMLVREDIENLSATSIRRASSYLKGLEAIAQVSPLLGLFGTVLGMIDAFQALQSSGTSVDPSVLAGGIWVALLTTAVGLGVAIPATLILSWFEAQIDDATADIENLVTNVLTSNVTGESPAATDIGAGSTSAPIKVAQPLQVAHAN